MGDVMQWMFGQLVPAYGFVLCLLVAIKLAS